MNRLFDQSLLDRRRRRAAARPVPGADFLLERACDEIVERLAAVKRSFRVAVDLATPTAALAARLAIGGLAETIFRLDRLPGARQEGVLAVVADPETLPLRDGSVDLVVSALALHWVDDLPGVLAQIRRALRPDGLFLAALLGGDTLHELREAITVAESDLRGGASPRVSPFAELRDLGALLQRAGFALPVADQDAITVRYDSALGLMQDLRAMGAANALRDRDRRPLPRAVLARTVEIYADRFADADGRVRATFRLVSLSGWSPDAGQQQPLRPGSARARLADALNATEFPSGEKPGG